MTDIQTRRSGPVARWRALAPAGKRRVGEFVANMLLVTGASVLTLLVLPAVSGRMAVEAWSMAAALAFSAVAALFAVLVRIFTEERVADAPVKAESP